MSISGRTTSVRWTRSSAAAVPTCSTSRPSGRGGCSRSAFAISTATCWASGSHSVSGVRPSGRNVRAGVGVEATVVDRPLDEPELIERAKRGDTAAYGELVQRHQGIAFRTAYVFARDASDAEEAAQDGFVKAYRALGRFRSGAPFRPWLLQIVANEARNRRRLAGRRANLALRVVDEARPGDAVPSPEAELLSVERRGELLAAVEGLREEERLVVSCRFFLGLSEDETAQTLGLKRGTVKSRTSRALAQLREEVER